MPTLDLRVADVMDNFSILPALNSDTIYEDDPLYWIGDLDPGNEVNFRFPGVSIPQGATILSATITGYARANWAAASDMYATLGAEQVDNATRIVNDSDESVPHSEFQTRSSNLGTTVQWVAGDSSGSGDSIPSPDISTLVQEVVNRAGWTSGNAIQFFTVSNVATGNDRQLWSYWNGDSALYPRLEISYEESPTDVDDPTVTLDSIHGSGQFDSVYDSSGYDSGTDTLSVTGSASDTGGSGLDTVEVRVDGGAWQTATGTTSWSIDLDASSFPTGSFTIEARATDGAGNTSTIDSETVWHSPSGTWGYIGASQHAIPLSILGWSTDTSTPSILNGVGSTSDSLTTYPKTGEITTADIYVDPAAATNGDGSLGSPFDNLPDALAAVADTQRIGVYAGTLTLTSGMSRSTSWPTGIEVFALGSARPVIDMSGIGTSRALSMSGSREHWKGFEFVDGDGGVALITGSHYTIEDCWAHRVGVTGSGGGMFYIYGHGNTGNVLQDLRVWRMGDGTSTTTNTPDGIKMHANYGSSSEVASGHAVVRSFVAHGPDDCFDGFYSNGNTYLDNVAYRAGYYWNGNAAADGTGFKAGSNNANTGNNTYRGCLAIANKNVGINSNFAPEPLDIQKCTVTQDVWRPYRAYATGSVVKNNIEYDNGGSVDVVGDTYNSWNLGISNPQFADIANFDFSLASGSPAIDAADDGDNIGASEIALELAKECLAMDLTT